MLAENPANNFAARLFGPDHRTNNPMPGLDEGDVIPLQTPAQARWGNKYTKAGTVMFNAADLKKEYAPDHFPNHYKQEGAEAQMAGIEQSALYAPRAPINGDLQDVINFVNQEDKKEKENYYANLGKDHLFDAMTETKMRMSNETYDTKQKELLSLGFTPVEAKKAIDTLRQEHADEIARRPAPSGMGISDSLSEAFSLARNRNA